ncbi:MAG TPA: LysM peptidoglycan-binding domain-containing protein [Acidimicrobiales bacterium]|nr:LysM peptidoglycan-binding domain-containing protein [Acidimicrobiales bacterium]
MADGTELLGRYEGSAYQQPHYLARRADGQVFHLSQLLYLVLLALNGERDLAGIAAETTAELGRSVVADNVDYLVENKLRPLGLVASSSEAPDEALSRSKPLLALRYRTKVIPARFHRTVTAALQFLFWPPAVLLVLSGLLAANVWLFGLHRHALTQAGRQLPFHPALFLLVTGLFLFSGFFHELGHAAGTRYGGASPGVMGLGIYLAFPAFYTDLTDSYRLNRRGRLRSDLGGVYFNAVLVVIALGVYLPTRFSPLLVFIVLSQAAALYQFLPFIRLDGYYIMSDLIGVPNLFAFVGPALTSLIRRHDLKIEARLALVNRRARVAIRAWAALTVVFLAFNLITIVLLAPVIFPSEWSAGHFQVDSMVVAFGHDNVASGLNGLVDLVFIAIAPLGVLLILGMMIKRLARALRKWWPTHRILTTAILAVFAGALIFQGQALVSRLAPAPESTVSVASGPTSSSVHAPPPLVPTPLPPGPNVQPPPATPLSTSYVYVVQPGDTLWALAAQHLGNPFRYQQLFALNRGIPQSGGHTLVDPNLIYPGMKLIFPADATGIPTSSVTSAPAPQATQVPSGGGGSLTSSPP